MISVPRGELESRRFVFVTGKGGVGKTTVAMALSIAFSQRNKRVLLALTGAHERVSAVFGCPPIGHAVVPLAPKLWASRIDPERAMEEYGALVLRVKTIAKLVFENRYTHGFFRAVPGLLDWAMLGKAWWHTTELEDGAPRFDVVVFDAPSTGHGLDMLRVPKVILDIVPPGILRRDAELAWEMFRDPKRAGVVLVTLPEEMPATEAMELARAVKDELALPIARVVVNARLKPIFVGAERSRLTADEELSAWALATAGGFSRGDVTVSPALGTLASAARRAAREELEERIVGELERGLMLPLTELPFLEDGVGSRAAVAALAALV
ncbi:MAG: anion-transporting ATPase [Myxococcales bacterium]|nr:anion-transporting ATPase [Myxococcales bacterium]